MNKQAIKTLLDTINFNSILDDYSLIEDLISNLVRKYDYQSVINELMRFKTLNISTESKNIASKLERHMNCCRLSPKLSEIDQISKERQEYEQFTNTCSQLLSNRPKMSKMLSNVLHQVLQYQTLQQIYKKYTYEFIMSKSKELNISISLICEKKGLIPAWLI